MPTGYTHKVQNGTVTDFAEFAMGCARAFGACIEMRDAPSDEPIPEAFHPGDYHLKAIEDAKAEIARLEAMTEADKQTACDTANTKARERWQERKDDLAQQERRYKEMLAKAEAWTPPTDDHKGLKDFMVAQLESSIKFDCSSPYAENPPKPMPVEDWFSETLARANKDLAYHAKERAEDIERARNRTNWVANLRASLALKTTETI